MTITGDWADDAVKSVDKRSKGVIFKSFASFIWKFIATLQR